MDIFHLLFVNLGIYGTLLFSVPQNLQYNRMKTRCLGIYEKMNDYTHKIKQNKAKSGHRTNIFCYMPNLDI